MTNITRKSFESIISVIHRIWKKALLIAIIVILTLTISSVISMWLSQVSKMRFPSIGNIITKGVKAYWDPELTNKTENITWGTLYVGSKTNVTLYLQSISNVDTIFELKNENWTFYAANGTTVSGPNATIEFMNVTWDCNEEPISPNGTREVKLTLIVDDTTEFIDFLIQGKVTNFSFDIVIQPDEENR